MNIYVSNLSPQTSNEDLKGLFGKFGEVSSANVIMDKYTGSSRGFAFVEMSAEDAGSKAIQELNNTQLNGKFISVSVARPRESRSGNGGSGGGYSKKW